MLISEKNDSPVMKRGDKATLDKTYRTSTKPTTPLQLWTYI